jgi:hypothetical protein
VPRAAADAQGSAERRLVDEAQRRRRTAELEGSGDDGAEKLLARPELAPARVGESRRELVVTVVLPVPELRLARGLPTVRSQPGPTRRTA